MLNEPFENSEEERPMPQLEPTCEIDGEDDDLKPGLREVSPCPSREKDENEQDEEEQEKDNHCYQNDTPCRGEWGNKLELPP